MKTLMLILTVLLGGLAAFTNANPAESKRPNIVLIMTDDQGFGDLGFHGNPVIRTPHLDQLARESVQFQSFYVSPVCAPTRASLMTGRYNYRTGVTDTYLGRALMHPDEVTLAEMLKAAGYRTGIFGKWHLGDNYPMRAMDQGFGEALTLNGGGIGQPSDLPGGESYFNPILSHTGKPTKTTGYVSDVITDAALQFIEQNRQRPFFVYLPFNAPHTPLFVPEDKYQLYKKLDLRPANFPSTGHPIAKNYNADTTAKIYGMVENIDDNVGRLLARLDELQLSENTIVIFLTDNGPQQPRYNAGMLRLKGTVNEGGIHVPFFVRWKGKLEAGRKVDRIAAHIDVAPTLLEICGLQPPSRVKFDGKSLWPLLQGDSPNWPDRTLFFQWHRGDAPQRYRAFAARSQNYKLVQPLGNGDNPLPAQYDFNLYDMVKDPLEQHDVAASNPDTVRQMKTAYEQWFAAVTAQRNFAAPSRIFIGAQQENPVRLTRQDWRGEQASWTQKGVGHWEVNVVRAGLYRVSARLNKLEKDSVIRFQFGNTNLQKEIAAGAETAVFENVRLSRSRARLHCYVLQDGNKIGVRDLEVTRLK